MGLHSYAKRGRQHYSHPFVKWPGQTHCVPDTVSWRGDLNTALQTSTIWKCNGSGKPVREKKNNNNNSSYLFKHIFPTKGEISSKKEVRRKSQLRKAWVWMCAFSHIFWRAFNSCKHLTWFVSFLTVKLLEVLSFTSESIQFLGFMASVFSLFKW